jgi:uracil-DNA glycosylase
MILMMHQEDGWDPHRFRLDVDLYIRAFLKWEYCRNRRESMGTQQEHGIQVLASVLELNIRFPKHFQLVLVGSLNTQVAQNISKSRDKEEFEKRSKLRAIAQDTI